MIDIDTPTPTPEQFKAFADVMATALGDRDDSTTRVMTEAEARAASLMFWFVTRNARVTVALWSLRNRKPTKDEMFVLTATLRAAEERAERMMRQPPSDGHALDGMIASLANHWDDLQEEAAHLLGPEVQQ